MGPEDRGGHNKLEVTIRQKKRQPGRRYSEKLCVNREEVSFVNTCNVTDNENNNGVRCLKDFMAIV